MPSVSKAQQRYFQIAEHHPEQLRGHVPKMSKRQLHDFARGSMQGKPMHVDAGKSGRKHRFEGETHAYQFRSRNNLRRAR